MNFIWRMNEAGLSVGDSCEGIWGNIGYCVGWKWDKELAAYQAPVHPKAVLTGINNRKQIVGLLYSSDGIPQAYLEYKGQFTLLSDRSSVAWDINDAGGSADHLYGYIRKRAVGKLQGNPRFAKS